MLPNFLVVGAPKAGSTALHHGLAEHPDVYMSPHKEPFYFSHFEDSPPHPGPGDVQMVPPGGRPTQAREMIVTRREDYEALFEGAADEKGIGEACPEYLYSAVAAARIRETIPSARCIAIFRNPVDRAYSSYCHLRRDGREPCETFAEALAREPERIALNWHSMWHFREVGYYGRQWQRYVDLFPPDQLYPILHDDLRKDAEATYRGMFEFLGVDPNAPVNLQQRPNRSGTPRSRFLLNLTNGENAMRRVAKAMVPTRFRESIRQSFMRVNLKSNPPLPDAVRAELVETFREDVGHLAKLLNRDLSHWLR